MKKKNEKEVMNISPKWFCLNFNRFTCNKN